MMRSAQKRSQVADLEQRVEKLEAVIDSLYQAIWCLSSDDKTFVEKHLNNAQKAMQELS